VGAYAELRTHVEGMARSQQQLQAETANLVKALRTPHIRGSWGEIQLRRVVEMAGMVEHCDFAEQTTVSDGDGGTLRPDLVIKLPGGKTIVVDSKAPLVAYLESADAPDEDARAAALIQHARHVKTHIGQLAAKAYWRQFENAPDFVVMFLPGESFFSAACQCDPGLVDYAVEQHVIPASPTTLITLLKTVQFGWRQERIAANAQEISELGRELYDRLRGFGTHLAACGASLAKSVEPYNRAVGSFEGRLLVSGRRFESLGCGTGGEIEILEPLDAARPGRPAGTPGGELCGRPLVVRERRRAGGRGGASGAAQPVSDRRVGENGVPQRRVRHPPEAGFSEPESAAGNRSLSPASPGRRLSPGARGRVDPGDETESRRPTRGAGEEIFRGGRRAYSRIIWVSVWFTPAIF
jgi:RmuC family protein